jgi:hypothetical protein
MSRVAEAFETERRDASTARVPSVPPGRAIVYTRYDQEKSVVLNPEDFHRLAELDEALGRIAADGPILSELAREAHALEDTPGEPVEDPGAIKKLLGL